jgi:hypothetical protein
MERLMGPAAGGIVFDLQLFVFAICAIYILCGLWSLFAGQLTTGVVIFKGKNCINIICCFLIRYMYAEEIITNNFEHWVVELLNLFSGMKMVLHDCN